MVRLRSIVDVFAAPHPRGAVERPDPAPDPLALELIVELGRALHRYGTQAERLEGTLEAVAASLGVRANFFSTPTMLMMAFGRQGQHGTRLLREHPGAVDLGRLTAVDQISQALSDGAITIAEGLDRLRAMEAPRTAREGLAEVAAAALLAGSVALPLGGNWLDALAATGVGLLVGVVTVVSLHSPRVGQLRDVLAAFIAGAAVHAIRGFAPINDHVVAIAGLVALLPGLTFTTAMTELATQHLASGTARFAAAIVNLVQLGLGLAIGAHIVARFAGVAGGPVPPWAVPDGWETWVLVPAVAFSFWLLFRSQARDLPWILVACVCALGGAHLGTLFIQPALAGFVGATFVGLLAHVYSRRLRRPAANVMVPGITFLVPGSVGLTSLSSFMERDVAQGVEGAFTMTLIAIALVAGILVSAILVPPRGSL